MAHVEQQAEDLQPKPYRGEKIEPEEQGDAVVLPFRRKTKENDGADEIMSNIWQRTEY